MYKLFLDKDIVGNILDIGGGGEGIIGRLYTDNVTAIDKYKEELDEAPDTFKKIQMNACNLRFLNKSFENVTAFYSFMFMEEIEQIAALKEIHRVLKSNGKLYIWDTLISNPKEFLVDLNVVSSDFNRTVTYGITKNTILNSLDHLIKNITMIGFKLEKKESESNNFYLVFSKIG